MIKPGLATVVPDLRSPLHHALDALRVASQTIAQLRADIIERDHYIATLQSMLERAYQGDTERPGAP